MIGGLSLSAMALASALALTAAAVPQAADAIEVRAEPRGETLSRLIDDRIRAGGPFFTPEERVVIERACGYAEGEWDGYQVNIYEHVLTCTNGRRASGPEVDAVLAVAEPRIKARIDALMADPEVRAAIARVADEAAVHAMRNVNLAMAGLHGLDRDVDAASGNVDIDVDVDVDVDIDTDNDRD